MTFAVRLLVPLAAAAVAIVGLGLGPAQAEQPQLRQTSRGDVTRSIELVLSRAIVDRLNVMPDVAYTKYVNNLEVSDPTREQAQLDLLVKRAHEQGADPVLAESVFRDQFSAAKQVQWKLFHDWNTGRRALPTYPPKDLSTQLRPLIDATNSELLAGLVAVEQHRGDPTWSSRFEAALTQTAESLDPAVGWVELANAGHSARYSV